MIDLIKQRLSTFSPAERRVAEWVRQNPEACLHTPVSALAEHANVSEPTVVRFCRTMDCTGLRDFKLRMAQSMADTRSRYHSDVNESDSLRDIATKVFSRSVHELNNAGNQLSSESIEQTVQALLDCRQLVFYGVGASGIVALDAQHKFFRLGIPCTAYTDVPTILQAASIADTHCAVIAISKSGNNTALAAATETARINGAAVITLTTANSALERAGTIKLRLHCNEDINVYTPMSSRLAQLCVLDALQVGLATCMGDTATEKLKRTKAALGK